MKLRASRPAPPEEHERERHLDYDQCAPQSSARAAFGGTARALLQRLVHIGARGEPRGRDAKNQPGEDAQRERKDEHSRIEMNVGNARKIRGSKGKQRIQSPAREQHAGQAAAEREENAFSQELADEPGPAGAKCGADRNLAVPRGRAREKEVGDIGAGDEQHAADRAEQGVEHSADIAHAVILQRHHEDAPAFVRIGILRRQLRGQDL